MGFRFRKTFTFGPFRTTLSKSGIGGSIGFRGFRYTLRADGKRQKTISIPGTGLSFIDTSKPGSHESDLPEASRNVSSESSKTQWGRWVLVLFFLLLLVLIFLMQFIR